MRYTSFVLNLSAAVSLTLAASVTLAQSPAATPDGAGSARGGDVVTPLSSTPAAAGPSTYSYPVTQPVDEPSTLRFPNRPLLITGSAVFAAFYLPAVIFQASENRNDDLYIPIAGPWMDLAKGDDGRTAQLILGVDGALQGLGALGLLASFAIPEKRTRNWYLLGSGRAFNVSPRSTAGGYALLANGRF